MLELSAHEAIRLILALSLEYLLCLNSAAAELIAVGGRVNAIVAGIDPAKITSTLDALSGAVASVTEVIEKVRNDPVLALSINKAADRIVAKKFEEMSKNNQFKSDRKSVV